MTKGTGTAKERRTSVARVLRSIDYRILQHHRNRQPDTLDIAHVTADSRNCGPDSLFVPLTGLDRDGHDYIGAAVASGCRAIVIQAGYVLPDELKKAGVLVIEVEDTAKAYSEAAASFFGNPAEDMKIIGVTGTNGKTTVCYLMEQILLDQGYNVGVIGTVNNRYTIREKGCTTLPTSFTTPEAFLLQQVLREMADSLVEYVVMEVSSHGLAQSRIGSITFAAAAFTNLSRDHLDYHRDMDDYFAAKLRLFAEHVPTGKPVVLPVDNDEAGNEYLPRLYQMAEMRNLSTVTWGDGKGDIKLLGYEASQTGTRYQLATPAGTLTGVTPLVGRFNIDNLQTALALGFGLGFPPQTMVKTLEKVQGAPGRLERVTPGEAWPVAGPVVLVDYAHTPDALEKVLATIGALPHGELFCVFGCGGDRDRGKRPLMGALAARAVDVVVVTDDNPRTESGAAIIEEILPGISSAGMACYGDDWLQKRRPGERGCVVLRDRRTAIDQAIRAARPGDIVLIAGKGHEPYQLTIQGKRFFDDRQEALHTLLSWTTERVAEAVGGEILAPTARHILLGEVVTDSRIVGTNTLFVALKGENHDAHDFVPQAIANGARCLLVERPLELPDAGDISQVLVADTLRALGDLAAYRRRRMARLTMPEIIGLTGSCGKTTVKEMVAAILRRRWPEGPLYPPDTVLQTRGNFNNLIGMPLSLLPLSCGHRAAVIEMGMNQPGELRRLGEIASPDISCITNIHAAHLEGLQSIEGVARAKEELFSATGENGTLVVNLDNVWIKEMASRYKQHQIRFAVDATIHETTPDLHATRVDLGREGVLTFTLHRGREAAQVHLFTAGEHNVSNALTAAAIATAAGAAMAEIVAGLADFRPPDKRMVMTTTSAGFTLIDDTYNANPASMTAGLKTLKQMARKRAMAIIGDMRELGTSAWDAHHKIGGLLAALQLDQVVVVGEHRQAVVAGALDGGLAPDRIREFAGKEEAAAWFLELVARKSLGQDDLVLVKASRGLRFETIVDRLVSAKTPQR